MYPTRRGWVASLLLLLLVGPVRSKYVHRPQAPSGRRAHKPPRTPTPPSAPPLKHSSFKLVMHPGDDQSTINPVFLKQNPYTFSPQRDPETGDFYLWGVPDANATLRRLRRVQPQAYGGPFWDGHALYGPDSSFGILRSPEQQFVDVLVQRKLDAIRRGAEDAQRFFTHRLQLQVVLLDINPPMFRRLTVSAGITLHTLHERVLAPAMGWHVSSHGYQFIDRKDGALFGPPVDSRVKGSVPHPKSGCRDLGYLNIKGHVMIDDRLVHLADLLRAPGDRLGYVYNLGMHWQHSVQVEAVLRPVGGPVQLAAPLARPVVMDGAMHCPPDMPVAEELMPGEPANLAYQAMLDVLLDKNHEDHHEVLLVASQAMNVEAKVFDPFHFDRRAVQVRLDHFWNDAPLHERVFDPNAPVHEERRTVAQKHKQHMQTLDAAAIAVLALGAVLGLYLKNRRRARSGRAGVSIAGSQRALQQPSPPPRSLNHGSQPHTNHASNGAASEQKVRRRGRGAKGGAMNAVEAKSTAAAMERKDSPPPGAGSSRVGSLCKKALFRQDRFTGAQPFARGREFLVQRGGRSMTAVSQVCFAWPTEIIRKLVRRCLDPWRRMPAALIRFPWFGTRLQVIAAGDVSNSDCRTPSPLPRRSSEATKDCASTTPENVELDHVPDAYILAANDGPNSASELGSDCVVCMVNKKGALLQPCGHCHTCYECALTLFKSDNQPGACPICRVPISTVLRAYM